MTNTQTTTENTMTGERAELLQTLAQHRFLFRRTADGLTTEQLGAHPTVSALCVGGLIKHVASVEEKWMQFVVEGADAFPSADDPAAFAQREAEFQMQPGDTLESILARYDEVAARTEEIVASLPDLDVSHALPEAPWFPPGARWSARRVLVHIVAETAQHAGHADIIREALDGQKTMG